MENTAQRGQMTVSDEVAIQMVQEDGTTEFAGASLILEVTL